MILGQAALGKRPLGASVAGSGPSFFDTGSGTITLAGTSTQSASHTASRTGTVTLSGVAVEGYTFGAPVATQVGPRTIRSVRSMRARY